MVPICTFERSAAPNPPPTPWGGQAAEPWAPWCLPPPSHQPCPTHTTHPSPPACPAYNEHEGGQQLSQAFSCQLIPDVEQPPDPRQERSGAHSGNQAGPAVTAAAAAPREWRRCLSHSRFYEPQSQVGDYMQTLNQSWLHQGRHLVGTRVLRAAGDTVTMLHPVGSGWVRAP